MMTLTEVQEEFVVWSIDPARSGTYASWAKDHNLSDETLRRWRKTEWYQQALEERLKDLYMSPEKVLDVVKGLQKEAAGGDVTAARLYMQWVEKLNPIKPVKEDRAIEAMTDEELDIEWERARGRL